MVHVGAPGPEYAAVRTRTMSKTGKIISGNAAAASLSVQNKRHSSKEKQSFVNQNESGNKKKKKAQKRANYTINSNLSARPPPRRSAVSRERLRAA